MDKNTATILHAGECPHDYECLAMDCMECMKMHQERECRHGD